MKIFIIGGTGHIGRNLVEMLIKEKFEIFILTSI
ncbi:MAG: NmrA family NAD(P)-binding protein [Candidatus Omnitrophica bacterium]|nr:NmrA family NAD(P)-binding protein [Candidatus Omnitrophota bacterium]MCM8832594.1 NmrA family NAD(P)-binding protein [Candidatus Omnitrophota bacterium]